MGDSKSQNNAGKRWHVSDETWVHAIVEEVTAKDRPLSEIREAMAAEPDVDIESILAKVKEILDERAR